VTRIQTASAERIAEERGNREQRDIDLRVQWVDWTQRETILDVGGVWDRKYEAFVGDGENAMVVPLVPSQYAAARWFAGWLEAYIKGGQRPPAYDRKWSTFWVGGRRSGKSLLAVEALEAFAVAVPHRIIWAISPTEDATKELQFVLEESLPEHWYHWNEGNLTFTLANYSKIIMRSGYKPSALKLGRVDLWLLNEGQEVSRRAYTKLRAPLADTGGLGIVAANPPDSPVGQWILDSYDSLKAGKKTATLFEFDYEKNPTIDKRALEDMAEDVDELEYRRDVKGEFIEIGDLVWRSWSPVANVKKTPEIGDITRRWTKRHFGREFGQVIGIDLQLTPWNSATVARFFIDPENKDDALPWFIDEVIIEGDEYDLMAAFDAMGYDPQDTALIIDASAWWQNNERTIGRGSEDMFRGNGWDWCYRPDTKARKNPYIFERVLATNARMRNAKGRRRLFVDPSCEKIAEALRRWPNKNGVPHKRSKYAHTSDAVSYLIWRFWPRKLVRKGVSVETIRRKLSQRGRDLDLLK